MIEITAIPAFKDNYIWLLRQGRNAVVVDPGDASPVLQLLSRQGLTLTAILVTHHHADHQGGVAALLDHQAVPVYGPAAEHIHGCSHPLSGGECVRVPGLDESLQVLDVGGHTRGHIAYYLSGSLFCGDALFGLGCGKLFEGSPAQMAASLARLAALPDETLVYCAHEYTLLNLPFARHVAPGNTALAERAKADGAARSRGESTVPSTLALEKATNPFLRCAEPEIIASARSRDPGVKTPAAVFAVLRAWRDEF